MQSSLVQAEQAVLTRVNFATHRIVLLLYAGAHPTQS
jgi:hypothetical protein